MNSHKPTTMKQKNKLALEKIEAVLGRLRLSGMADSGHYGELDEIRKILEPNPLSK